MNRDCFFLDKNVDVQINCGDERKKTECSSACHLFMRMYKTSQSEKNILAHETKLQT